MIGIKWERSKVDLAIKLVEIFCRLQQLDPSVIDLN